MFSCKKCLAKDLEKKSLERENILLRTQLSDLLQGQLEQQNIASKERQALLDSFFSLLGGKRTTNAVSSQPRTSIPSSLFPGSIPNLRPPYPSLASEATPMPGEKKDLSLSDKLPTE